MLSYNPLAGEQGLQRGGIYLFKKKTVWYFLQVSVSNTCRTMKLLEGKNRHKESCTPSRAHHFRLEIFKRMISLLENYSHFKKWTNHKECFYKCVNGVLKEFHQNITYNKQLKPNFAWDLNNWKTENMKSICFTTRQKKYTCVSTTNKFMSFRMISFRNMNLSVKHNYMATKEYRKP